MKYNEVVQYRGESLFSGAIDSDWFLNQPDKSVKVARSYIFHGKNYHVGSSSKESSQLIDSVSFSKEILYALTGRSKENMMIAIAGYGAGKTHFAIALSVLLSTRDNAVRNEILSSIAKVDAATASEIKGMLQESEKPFLVVPVNGILSNSSLRDMFFKSLRIVLARDHQISKAMESFDSKYCYLKQTLSIHSNRALVSAILRDSALSMEDFEYAMDSFDIEAFERVKKACSKNGLALYETASSGELKDLLISVSNELCGAGKPYRAMLLVFDEFGKYMSFAAANESIAGSGIMQQLFDGIQGSDENGENRIVLLGFSQLDLKQYQNSIGDSLVSSNMNRYVTRFDTAKRYHLSVSFESLIANLLYKQPVYFKLDLDDDRLSLQVTDAMKNINRFFPVSQDYPVWSKPSLFASVICKGCWPLSPYLTWTLSYISSKNDILQQRSGLNLLGSIIEGKDSEDVDTDAIGGIPAVSLFDVGLLEELVSSEQLFFRADPIATEYGSIMQKYGANLSENEIRVLQSIVLSHKLVANVASEIQSRELLSKLSNLDMRTVGSVIKKCVAEYNFLAFDQITKLYNIQSNSVSFAEFNKDIQNQCASFYSGHDRQALFGNLKSVFAYTELNTIRDEFFSDLETDFAFEKNIRTEEWGYAHQDIFGYGYASEISRIIEADKLDSCTAYNQKKGKLFIVVLPRDIPIQTAQTEIKHCFSSANARAGFVRPYMALVYHDVDDTLLNLSIRYTVLSGLTKEKVERYSSLIVTDKGKTLDDIRQKLDDYKNKKNYVYPIDSSSRLKVTGEEIFELTYPKAISFPVDGFGMNSKNGPESLRNLYPVLMNGNCSWTSFTALDVMYMNRANSLLKEGWKCFGPVAAGLKRLPGNEKLQEFFLKLDEQLESEGQINFYGIFESLILPPYGANTTQATLIAFLYLGARLGSVALFNDDGQVTINEKVGQKTNFDTKTKALIEKVWNGIWIKPAIQDDAQWYNLIDRWKQCRSLADLRTCLNEAERLCSNSITLPPLLVNIHSELAGKTKNAIEINMQWKTKWADLALRIDNEISANKLDAVASLLNWAITFHNSLSSKGSIAIEPFQEEYEEKIGIGKVVIEEGLSAWIASQPLSVATADKKKTANVISGFKEFIKNLEAIGLFRCANEIKKAIEDYNARVLEHSQAVTAVAKLKITVDKIERDISQIVTESIANADMKTIDDVQKSLLTINKDSLVDYSNNYLLLIRKCAAAKETLYSKLRGNAEAYQSLLQSKIKTYEDCEVVKRGLEKACLFYQGENSKNFEEIKLFRTEIDLLENAYLQLNRNISSNEELQDELCDLKEKINQILNGKSKYDDDEILNHFYNEIIAARAEMSSKWMAEKERSWHTGDSSQIERLIVLLKEPPVYISEGDLARCKSMLLEIEEVKRANKINDLVSKFNALSPSEKELFLGKIKH